MKKLVIVAALLCVFATPAMSGQKSTAAMGGTLTGIAVDSLLFHGEPYLNSWERTVFSGATGVLSGVMMAVANEQLQVNDGIVYGAIGSFVGALISETTNSYLFVSKSQEQFTIGVGGRF